MIEKKQPAYNEKKQKRFILEFQKPFSLKVFEEDPLLKKELNIVFFNESQTKLEVFIKNERSIDKIIIQLVKLLDISTEEIHLINRGNSISNLFIM